MNKIDDLINKIKALGYQHSLTAYHDDEEVEKQNYNFRVWSIPAENYKLKNTPFFYEEDNDFIHFTSLESLYGMLNSRHLRLYNLTNMDDKFEVEYGRKELLLPSLINDDDKEQLYCFSMCPSSAILDEPKKKKHLLWKLHGRDGYGVIIRLKIMNDLASWCNYYLTKCFYTLDEFQTIKQLNELTKKEILDPLVASFIKLPIYEFENEVRIVFNKRESGEITNNGELLYPLTYLDKLHKSNKISYFQLPIWNFCNDNVYFNPPLFGRGKFEMPKIAITEIILGYRYNEDDLKKLKDNIALYDSSINVKMSDLKQYY